MLANGMSLSVALEKNSSSNRFSSKTDSWRITVYASRRRNSTFLWLFSRIGTEGWNLLTEG